MRPDSRLSIRRSLAALSGLAMTGAVLAAAPAGVARVADDLRSLRAELARIISAPGWSSARWSVLAVSLDSGDTLFAQHSHDALAPASNMKLMTAAAALERLGPDFRYETFALGDGSVKEGVLEGDLILYGTGDPAISDRFTGSRTAIFEALAEELKTAGIERISGNVVGDGSYFAGPLLHEDWNRNDLNDWYAAPVSALSFNENVVTLRVIPGDAAGRIPQVRTLPEGADLPLVNRSRTVSGRARSSFGIGRRVPAEPIVIEGDLEAGSRDRWREITVPDPPYYAATIFLRTLEDSGIEVDGYARAVSSPRESRVTGRRIVAPSISTALGRPPTVLAVHRSPPLTELLEVLNKKSHNLYAELVLKTLGRIEEGEGSFTGGSRVVARFLEDDVGLEPGEVLQMDGSGLSRNNRASAYSLVKLLGYMADSGSWEAYWSSLPEAGNRSELARMYRSAAAGNLRAKTGTIRRVSALSGMVKAANGERIVFSIVANEVPSTWSAKRVEDRIGTRLASFARPLPQLEEVRTPDRIATRPPAGMATSDTGEGAIVDGASGNGSSDPTEDPRSSSEGPPEPRTHEVVEGENLTLIARRYGVTLEALEQANPEVEPDRILPGMRLRIPEGR